MGSFFTRDKIKDYHVSLLDDNIENMDRAIAKFVINMGKIISKEGQKNHLKRQRIDNGGKYLYTICYNICDVIEPDPSEMDDIMVISEMCKYRIQETYIKLTCDEWLTLWDETIELLEKIERNMKNFEHMHYYLTMCHALKVIKFIYIKSGDY